MNGTPDEFRRALVQAFGDAVSATADGALLTLEGTCLHFSMSSLAPLKIGALHMAMLRVEINVRQGDQAAVEKLLARVDRATLRGGG